MANIFAEGTFSTCFVLFCLGLHHTACGMLVPRPGIEPLPSAVRAQSPNHCTNGEFPVLFCLNNYLGHFDTSWHFPPKKKSFQISNIFHH